MDPATQPQMESEPASIQSLYQILRELIDPRRAQGKRYSLALSLCLLILAKLAGQKTLSGATEWIRHRGKQLVQGFGVARERMPCQTTYSNVLAVVDGKQFAAFPPVISA